MPRKPKQKTGKTIPKELEVKILINTIHELLDKIGRDKTRAEIVAIKSERVKKLENLQSNLEKELKGKRARKAQEREDELDKIEQERVEGILSIQDNLPKKSSPPPLRVPMSRNNRTPPPGPSNQRNACSTTPKNERSFSFDNLSPSLLQPTLANDYELSPNTIKSCLCDLSPERKSESSPPINEHDENSVESDLLAKLVNEEKVEKKTKELLDLQVGYGPAEMKLPDGWAACPVCNSILVLSDIPGPDRPATKLNAHIKAHWLEPNARKGGIEEIARGWRNAQNKLIVMGRKTDEDVQVELDLWRKETHKLQNAVSRKKRKH